MAGETLTTVIGNLTDDPELRFTQSGAAVASFTVASTPRVYDKQSNEWKDGDALFLRCSVWREMAENVAESLVKGMRVVVQGNLKQRSWQDREGQNRISVELDVVEVGPSLFRATANVTRNQRNNGQQQQQRPPQQGNEFAQTGAPAAANAYKPPAQTSDDAWADRNQPPAGDPPF